MDVFSWSVPFLAEKVTNMLYNIIKKGGDESCDVDIDAMLKKDGNDDKKKK